LPAANAVGAANVAAKAEAIIRAVRFTGSSFVVQLTNAKAAKQFSLLAAL
jgi:hypothetical protein